MAESIYSGQNKAAATTRIFQPKDNLLFKAPPQNCGPNGAGQAQLVRFAIPTPSARLLVKLAIIFWPPLAGQSGPLLGPPDNPVDVFLQNSIFQPWKLLVYTAEQAESGWLIPTGDLVGTLLAINGQNIPVTATASGSVGVSGFSLDVQGGQDWVAGALIVPPMLVGYAAPSCTGLNITLRVRYEALGTEMCEDEWRTLTSKLQVQCSPTIVFT